MNLFKIILAILAFGLIIFNATKLDFSNLGSSESLIAFVGIISCVCALLLLAILQISNKIYSKLKEKQGL